MLTHTDHRASRFLFLLQSPDLRLSCDLFFPVLNELNDTWPERPLPATVSNVVSQSLSCHTAGFVVILTRPMSSLYQVSVCLVATVTLPPLEYYLTQVIDLNYLIL